MVWQFPLFYENDVAWIGKYRKKARMLKLFNMYFSCSEYEPTLRLESLATIIEHMDLDKVLALLKKPR